MPNPFFRFKEFTVYHDRCAMKVTTDACLFGAWVANRMEGKANTQRLLDIGTGTGLLSLMIAQKNEVSIDAVEIDAGAAEQAMENVKASPWAERIRVLQQNILDHDGRYDWVVSNPPFYEQELFSQQHSRNIAHHGAELGLQDLFRYLSGHLSDQGKAWLLLPFKRKNEIIRMLTECGFYVAEWIEVHPSFKHEAFRLMMEIQKQPVEANHATFFIRDEKDQYTAPFIQLLQPYYLYL